MRENLAICGFFTSFIFRCPAAKSGMARNLENRLGATPQEFESLPLRHNWTPVLIQCVSKRVSSFFLQKPLFARVFPIPFNESRLYGNRETVTVEPFCVFAYILFMVAHLAAFSCDYSYLNSITVDSPPNNSASFSAARLICPSLV